MTDRIKGFVVTLDHDRREDDAEPILNAIKMIRGVLSVKPVVADVNDHMNRQRIRHEIRERLWDVFEQEEKGK